MMYRWNELSLTQRFGLSELRGISTIPRVFVIIRSAKEVHSVTFHFLNFENQIVQLMNNVTGHFLDLIILWKLQKVRRRVRQR